MARAETEETASAYYPPRARWYSPLFYFGGAIQRRLALNRIQVHLPRTMTLGGLMASFLVPGLGFYIRGSKFWGKAALAGGVLLLLVFLAAFGYRIGNLAFGLLLSIHVSGFMFYCRPSMEDESLGSRLIYTLLAVLAIGLLLYLPARNVVLQHWLVPLRVNGRVFVVQRNFPAAAIQRSDWIAYKLGRDSNFWETGGGHGTVYIRSGMGLGPVLAVAGDRVMFSTNGFTVNGITHALLPYMPQSGEVTLQEKQWFIWPELGIRGEGNAGIISATMLQMATVSREQFIGKPFKRWLWRRQITP